MGQQLRSILEGYKNGKWEIVEPYTINKSYDFNQFDRLISLLAPIQAQYNEFINDETYDNSLEKLTVFYELDENKSRLERQLDALLYKPPCVFTDAFELTGAGYELQAILGVFLDKAIRSCEEFSVVNYQEGLPYDCSILVNRFIQWFALQHKSVFENVNLLSPSIDNLCIRYIDVCNLLKFDWLKRIKRYCYVKQDIIKDFGNGEKLFSLKDLMKYYENEKLFFAAHSIRSEYTAMTYYTTHIDSVGGERFQSRLNELNKNYNIYQKQRIILLAYW
jgi:hypothetical protein